MQEDTSFRGDVILSVNYVSVNEDIGLRLPQLYYIKMKIFHDLCFNDIGVAMAT